MWARPCWTRVLRFVETLLCEAKRSVHQLCLSRGALPSLLGGASDSCTVNMLEPSVAIDAYHPTHHYTILPITSTLCVRKPLYCTLPSTSQPQKKQLPSRCIPVVLL